MIDSQLVNNLGVDFLFFWNLQKVLKEHDTHSLEFSFPLLWLLLLKKKGKFHNKHECGIINRCDGRAYRNLFNIMMLNKFRLSWQWQNVSAWNFIKKFSFFSIFSSISSYTSFVYLRYFFKLFLLPFVPYFISSISSTLANHFIGSHKV